MQGDFAAGGRDGERAVVVVQLEGELVGLEAAFVGELNADDARNGGIAERFAVDGEAGNGREMAAAAVGEGGKYFVGGFRHGVEQAHDYTPTKLRTMPTARPSASPSNPKAWSATFFRLMLKLMARALPSYISWLCLS